MVKSFRPVLLSLMLGALALPAVAADLEQPMKKMGFNYKQATKADDAAGMTKYIEQMKAEVEKAKKSDMPAAKKEKFLEGLGEVETELDASLTALKAGDEATARAHLDKVNDLKKEYHKYAKQKG
ncbi:MAG: cytochrome b562 [Aeromonas sp.]|jgi:soluble cytochrome b562